MKHKIALLLIVLSLLLGICGCGKTSSFDWKETDGNYYAEVTCEGGTGKATVLSPALIIVTDGKIEATIEWSSKNYDYMIVDGVKYLNLSEAGENSKFTFPIEDVPSTITVIADTTAMSKPHEIEYVLTFSFSETEYTKLEKTGSLDLQYATGFSVIEYGHIFELDIKDGDRYLIVPAGMKVTDTPDELVVLNGPFDKTYLVATSVGDMLSSLGVTDSIRLSGTKEEDWYIDEIRTGLSSGDILYAGKYSAPDYELILGEGCNLAIESTMISHNPEVKEKLEELGIPVFVERSSYEESPLGRMEWIKVYGLLYDRLDEACRIYDEQIKEIEPVLLNENTDKTVAFFYVTANGAVSVRKPNDYISKMIGIAGGKYVLNDCLEAEDNAFSSMNMQMEDFYANAKDADYLIYNSTIDGELENIDDFLAINPLFKDFKAVKEGHVYCTYGNFFQESMGSCAFIKDLNDLLTGKSQNGFRYLKKL